ncbi:hypothetical protein RHMOL_Rhmol09G0027000 [Rhododendron molle]|uniref:Uncharacterized protein n=1 Tax=Rhododendron molle TaxID=49168 RepID=A0ACC0MAQ3_RHOML|nr:hypothetical protein RHMOL_Rhmol09G0027000 [Rhododendron molle]
MLRLLCKSKPTSLSSYSPHYTCSTTQHSSTHLSVPQITPNSFTPSGFPVNSPNPLKTSTGFRFFHQYGRKSQFYTYENPVNRVFLPGCSLNWRNVGNWKGNGVGFMRVRSLVGGVTRGFCSESDREVMSYDVVIVGAGPAGLSAAIRLKQLCREKDVDLSVCVVEKGAEVGLVQLAVWISLRNPEVCVARTITGMDGQQKKDIFECVYFPGGILEYQIGLWGNLIFTERLCQEFHPNKAALYGNALGLEWKVLRPKVKCQRDKDCAVDVEMIVGDVEKDCTHILSGNVFEPRALHELLPQWKQEGAPIDVPVSSDKFWFLTKDRAISFPSPFDNKGNYVISLSQLVRWLGEKAEELGVEVYPGFAASEILYDADDKVIGIATNDMGIAKDGSRRDNFQRGVELKGKSNYFLYMRVEAIGMLNGRNGFKSHTCASNYMHSPGRLTLLGEGCRGSLSEKMIKRYNLREKVQGQHQTYALGIKEVWEVDASKHEPGFVLHTLGWPLDNKTYGGSFLYHMKDRQVSIGLVVALNYHNPFLNPYEEFQELIAYEDSEDTCRVKVVRIICDVAPCVGFCQIGYSRIKSAALICQVLYCQQMGMTGATKLKHHPAINRLLEGGTVLQYGARTLNEGGFQSIPYPVFPGGAIIGCSAGFLNVPKIKGTHTAMKSGMLAAEAAFDVLHEGLNMDAYWNNLKNSWIWEELYRARNYRPAFEYGLFPGLALSGLERYIFKGRFPVTLKHGKPDHEATDVRS